MKNVMISIGLVLVTVVTILILFTVYGQNTRQNELDEALSVAVEQTLQNLKIDKNYVINNEAEFKADLVQNIVLAIESDSSLEVKILALDMEKGLLDVEATETFKQPNGSKGSVTSRKTVILEEYRQKEPVYYFVKFKTVRSGEDYKDEVFTDYKTFSICERSNVIFPDVSPNLDGYEFKGWSLTKPSKENDFSPELVSLTGDDGAQMTVTNELVFYAVFEEVSA